MTDSHAARMERIFADQLGLEVPSSGTDLIETGLLDSLMLVELVMAVEREFDVRIDLAKVDLSDLRTIQSIADLVRLM